MKAIQTLLAVLLLKTAFALVDALLRLARPAATPASAEDWATV